MRSSSHGTAATGPCVPGPFVPFPLPSLHATSLRQHNARMVLDVGAATKRSTEGPAERLAALVTAVSTSGDATAAMAAAAEHAARAFDADHAEVTCGDRTVSSGPPPSAEQLRTMASMAVPLGVHGSGSLCVRRDGARPFGVDDVAVLTSMARVIVMAVGLLDNRAQEDALLSSLHERQDLLERLARIQRSIFHRAPLQEVLD